MPHSQAHEGPGPSPSHLAVPPCTHGKGAREGTRPPPFPIRVQGGRTGHSAPPHRVGPALSLLSVQLRPRGQGACKGRLPHLSMAPYARKGAREAGHPPSLSHSHGRGVHEGTPPRLSASPPPPPSPPFPLCATPFAQKGVTRGHTAPTPLFPIRAEGGCTRACPPGTPLPLGHATPSARGTPNARAHHPQSHPSPFTRKGVARGYAAPGTSLPPWSRRPVCVGKVHAKARPHPSSFARKGCARRHATPFTQDGAHEAKPSPPPHVLRSRAGAVSVCPHLLRLHPVFARHSTT
ncbi:hypothetical protein EDB85DRAFT_1887301 [Lactarius pseudohatsudake]|nr:hypothetical protein EDB85DRAFT_1887301 [Lactarius pseudohatsudake]